jgi:hypothetical protein
VVRETLRATSLRRDFFLIVIRLISSSNPSVPLTRSCSSALRGVYSWGAITPTTGASPGSSRVTCLVSARTRCPASSLPKVRTRVREVSRTARLNISACSFDPSRNRNLSHGRSSHWRIFICGKRAARQGLVYFFVVGARFLANFAVKKRF